MKLRLRILNLVVAAVLALPLCDAAARAAGAEDLDRLFFDLQGADRAEARRIADDIERIWSRSGSAAMDLLLERGNAALEQGEITEAIDHLTALTDHAPDFAEGWNARALAYFHAGRTGPAIADLQRVLALNPRHFGALAGFGAILETIDRPAQALEVYRAALAIHPHLDGIEDAVKRLEAKVAGQEI
ncbi:tetratricopeptide repeat protein [Gemmobacter denitrificans]|uniref:Tetratricopeptide repeat protein n=1 Tax=Gemmobacter denitrificans TaxID=3123040 RepID=A0ABU8BTJ2_9RHOB